MTATSKSPGEEAVPADTVSAASSEGSLTPQKFEAKAREIAFAQFWNYPDHGGIVTDLGRLSGLISSALSTAFEEGKRVERERCAKIADDGMLVPPDGGSPTDDEIRVAQDIASAIRKEQTDDC